MTRAKLSRIRRKYNAQRRFNLGWRPMQWDVMVANCADQSEGEFCWWLKRYWDIA